MKFLRDFYFFLRFCVIGKLWKRIFINWECNWLENLTILLWKCILGWFSNQNGNTDSQTQSKFYRNLNWLPKSFPKITIPSNLRIKNNIFLTLLNNFISILTVFTIKINPRDIQSRVKEMEFYEGIITRLEWILEMCMMCIILH